MSCFYRFNIDTHIFIILENIIYVYVCVCERERKGERDKYGEDIKRGIKDKGAPKMAKRLDVITMKGSRVTPKTAGIEST